MWFAYKIKQQKQHSLFPQYQPSLGRHADEIVPNGPLYIQYRWVNVIAAYYLNNAQHKTVKKNMFLFTKTDFTSVYEKKQITVLTHKSSKSQGFLDH